MVFWQIQRFSLNPLSSSFIAYAEMLLLSKLSIGVMHWFDFTHYIFNYSNFHTILFSLMQPRSSSIGDDLLPTEIHFAAVISGRVSPVHLFSDFFFSQVVYIMCLLWLMISNAIYLVAVKLNGLILKHVNLQLQRTSEQKYSQLTK